MTLAGRDLAIGYRDRVVGRGLDVNLREGEVLALLGPNGSGKTTLLKTLLGILAPLGGAALIDERQIASYAAPERARRIAYVPQSHVPSFAFTVETVVLMGRTAHGNLFSAPSAADRGQLIRNIPVLGSIDDIEDVIADFARRNKPIARVVMTPSAFEPEALGFAIHGLPGHSQRSRRRRDRGRDRADLADRGQRGADVPPLRPDRVARRAGGLGAEEDRAAAGRIAGLVAETPRLPLLSATPTGM